MVQEDGETYRVVGTNGKIMSGDKKVIKDKEGGWLILLNGRFAARVEDDDKPRWYNGDEGPGFYHYDQSSKEDKYSGGLIVNYDSDAVLDNLPDEERLNFE